MAAGGVEKPLSLLRDPTQKCSGALLNRGNGSGRNKGGTGQICDHDESPTPPPYIFPPPVTTLPPQKPRRRAAAQKANDAGYLCASFATPGPHSTSRSKWAGGDAHLTNQPVSDCGLDSCPNLVQLELKLIASTRTKTPQSPDPVLTRPHFYGNQSFEEEAATYITGFRCCFTESLALPPPGLPIISSTGQRAAKHRTYNSWVCSASFDSEWDIRY
ncbi:hypothetical protein C8R47DRAFT_1199360 [Mycena vitilis]|nr:hypothetical protein C8R47DRAFT_1199360 [Mycena vitilis]